MGSLSVDKQEKLEKDAVKAEKKAEKKAEAEQKKKEVSLHLHLVYKSCADRSRLQRQVTSDL
jgi:hypothetical protein